MNNITNTISKNIVPISLSFSMFLIILILTPLLIINYLNSDNNQITIKPEINLNKDIIECLNNNSALTVTITSPTQDQQFQETDYIKFEGKMDFVCKELLSDEDYKVHYQWFLNSDTSTISEYLSGDLGQLNHGDYSLIFQVSLDVIGLKHLEQQTQVAFIVNQTLPSITPMKIIPINKPPSVRITSPKSGTYSANQYDPLSGKSYRTFNFTGSGDDPEDGALTQNSLAWYYETSTSGRTLISYGGDVTTNLYVNYCSNETYTITLVAKDSKGITTESSITLVISDACIY